MFDAFSSIPVLNDVNPRVLRALIARSYDLVRHDIPKIPVNVDFKMLTESVSSSNSFAKLFGIANVDDYSLAAAQHPLSATQLGKLLGGSGWHTANALLDKLKAESGFDIKSSDNRYHRSELVNTSRFHKYSHDCLDLLKKIRDGEAFEVALGPQAKGG